MSDRVLVVFRRADGQWDFHVVAPNGVIVEGSMQGFTERNDAAEAARREHPDLELTYEEER